MTQVGHTQGISAQVKTDTPPYWGVGAFNQNFWRKGRNTFLIKRHAWWRYYIYMEQLQEETETWCGTSHENVGLLLQDRSTVTVSELKHRFGWFHVVTHFRLTPLPRLVELSSTNQGLGAQSVGINKVSRYDHYTNKILGGTFQVNKCSSHPQQTHNMHTLRLKGNKIVTYCWQKEEAWLSAECTTKHRPIGLLSLLWMFAPRHSQSRGGHVIVETRASYISSQ